MGFFSFVGKALGKVAKTGLSVVTGGVSDKILSAAKSLGTAKATATKAAGNLTTLKQTVAVQKAAPKMSQASAKATVKRITSKRTPAQIDSAMKYTAKIVKPKKGRTVKKSKKRRDVPSGAKRTPPKGGLDLAKMAKQWAAAGKPGKWIDWVKSPGNQIRKG